MAVFSFIVCMYYTNIFFTLPHLYIPFSKNFKICFLLQSRCAVYFPQSTLITQPPYGDFQVSLLKKDVYEFYTMSTLRLLDLEVRMYFEYPCKVHVCIIKQK